MNSKTLLFLLGALLIIFNGCKPNDPIDDDHDHDHDPEEELITTFTYMLTSADGSTVVLSFKDLDGDGGDEPVVNVEGNFKANTSYSGIIELLNEDEDPAHDVSDEVKDEAAEHQFFFSSSASGIEVSYDDEDANGNPIGLETTLKTGDPESGDLKITLVHKPDKTAEGVKEGKSDNAGGETDIEVTFNIVVE